MANETLRPPTPYGLGVPTPAPARGLRPWPWWEQGRGGREETGPCSAAATQGPQRGQGGEAGAEALAGSSWRTSEGQRPSSGYCTLTPGRCVAGELAGRGGSLPPSPPLCFRSFIVVKDTEPSTQHRSGHVFVQASPLSSPRFLSSPKTEARAACKAAQCTHTHRAGSLWGLISSKFYQLSEFLKCIFSIH